MTEIAMSYKKKLQFSFYTLSKLAFYVHLLPSAAASAAAIEIEWWTCTEHSNFEWNEMKINSLES